LKWERFKQEEKRFPASGRNLPWLFAGRFAIAGIKAAGCTDEY
jgi:hypothetical protein